MTLYLICSVAASIQRAGNWYLTYYVIAGVWMYFIIFLYILLHVPPPTYTNSKCMNVDRILRWWLLLYVCCNYAVLRYYIFCARQTWAYGMNSRYYTYQYPSPCEYRQSRWSGNSYPENIGAKGVKYFAPGGRFSWLHKKKLGVKIIIYMSTRILFFLTFVLITY